jgi:predicted flap endonuclease-1-like 5' DNA nuclease
MTMFLIQSAILIAIAFLVGCIIGCLLKRMFATEEAAVPTAVATTLAAATAATATLADRPEPEPQPEPEPVKDPEPAPAMAVALPAAKPAPKDKPAPRAKPAAKPAPAPKPKVAAAPAQPDDLKLIVGIGPVNERKLNALKVNRFAQIAAWTPKDEVTFGEKLEFPGRIEREEWVRQAKKLAAGGKSEDSAELARKGGKTASAAPKAAGILGSGAVKTAKAPAAITVAAKPSVQVAEASAKPTEKNPSGKAATAKPAAIKAAQTKTAPTKTAPTKTAPTKAAPTKTASPKRPMAAKLAKPVGGKPDNLTLINGIGNVIEKKLHGMGVFHFEQIASWSKAQAEDFSRAVGFPGRAERENWMKEAAVFMKGGTTDHARKVEKGEIPTSRKSTAAEKAKPKK